MVETNRVMVPMMVQAKPFEVLEANGVEKALAQCVEAGYSPLFMPQIADSRILALKDDYVVTNWFTTPSVRVTGKTKGGNAVVVYAHVPNYFSTPVNITTAREAGLVNGAGKMPQHDFYQLLDLEDQKDVYVVDHNVLRSAESGVVTLSKAMKHPQTIPFLGGQDRAEKYLAKHNELYGNTIGIWHCDDLGDVPQGRALFLGDYCSSGLNSNDILNFSGGRFLGVATESPKAVLREAQRETETVLPSLDVLVERL